MKLPIFPAAAETEKAVLARIMIDGERMAEQLCPVLREELFYSQINRLIFTEMLLMIREGLIIDLVSFTDRVTTKGIIERCGGITYLSSLGDYSSAAIGDPHDYVLTLKKYAMYRALALTGDSLKGRSLSANEDPFDIIESTMNYLKNISTDMSFCADLDEERKASVDLCALLETASPAVAVTGLPRLDDILGGFRAGELIVIAADTGVGKTIFARQIRRASCQFGIHGLYCSGEMDASQLVSRDISAYSAIPLSKFRNPSRMTREDHSLALETAVSMCDKCAILAGNLSLGRIRSAVMEMRRRGNLGFIVVDYDELVEAPGSTDFERQAAVALACKELSMAQRAPTILLSQLRKIQQGERADKPALHRLYGSAAKIKFASVILQIDRPFVRELKGSETAAKISVLKNRNGILGEISALFNVHRMRFTETDEPLIP